MNKGRERREARRITHICEVECDGTGISRLATRITDLSTTGAFIDSMTNFAVGTRLGLKFRVKDATIETMCQVRYQMPQVGMGVQFLDLRPEYLAVLEHFVEGKPLSVPLPVSEPKPAPPGEVRNMLTGNFAVVSLFDVIQIVENNNLSGALIITSPSARGEIHFRNGQIVGALSSSLSGQAALIKFLDVTEGVFGFDKLDIEYPRTIAASSNTSLMLDLVRVKDEETAYSPVQS